MEARIKKLFHRKKDTSSEEHLQQTHMSNAARSSPALRTSLYDTVPTGGPPQTGPYPIKGDNSSAVLQKRKASQRNRGPSDPIPGSFNSSPTRRSNHIPRATPIIPSLTQHDFDSSAGKLNQPNRERRSEGDSRRQHNQFETPLSKDFSALNLKNEQSISKPDQSQISDNNPTPFSNQTQSGLRKGNDNLEEPSLRRTVPVQTQTGTTFRASENIKDHLRNQSPYSSAAIYSPRSDLLRHEAELTRKKSISRKQVGENSESQANEGHSSPTIRQVKSKSSEKPLCPSSDLPKGDCQTGEEGEIPAQSDKERWGPGSRNFGVNSAENIVNQAHDNSVHTEVAESWAPAVVHETVHQDVHHMREELITREVHHHDIYHRILPVIDVEVLPPRHFLPVEGGGLVEINAEEVPGRGRNWVIAETASKIPSGQVAPTGANQFSAREFPGEEGDPKRYLTPKGIRTTEETWVHPPDLETGGRDTGQTWPMVFGDHGNSKTGKGKKKEEFKMPPINHSSPAEGPG